LVVRECFYTQRKGMEYFFQMILFVAPYEIILWLTRGGRKLIDNKINTYVQSAKSRSNYEFVQHFELTKMVRFHLFFGLKITQNIERDIQKQFYKILSNSAALARNYFTFCHQRFKGILVYSHIDFTRQFSN
jgi:hypothetical protein